MRIARVASICAVSFLLAALASQAITEYNKDSAESLRLLDSSKDLSDCCLDTTFVQIEVSWRRAPDWITGSSEEYTPVTTHYGTCFPDTTIWRDLAKAKWLRVRVQNNP